MRVKKNKYPTSSYVFRGVRKEGVRPGCNAFRGSPEIIHNHYIVIKCFQSKSRSTTFFDEYKKRSSVFFFRTSKNILALG